jgi:DNA polymerase I-like protein with 3'-5' exonuclease and polymerase domains
MTYAEYAEAARVAWARDKPQVISVDTETEGTAYFDRAFCAVVAWRRPEPTMVCIGTGPGPKNVRVGDMVLRYSDYKKLKQEGRVLEKHYIEFGDEDHTPVLRRMLAETPTLVFHNAKFDMQKLILHGCLHRHELTPTMFEDTQTLAGLQWVERRKGLKYLAEVILGIPNTEEEELKAAMTEHGFKVDDGYHLLPRNVLIPYALQDAVDTILLYEVLRPYVGQHPELEELYLQDRKTTLALLDMEARGLVLDVEYVEKQIKALSKEFIQLEASIAAIVGKPVGKAVKKGEFNPGSPKQLGEYFEAKGIETPFKTAKGNPSWNDDFMELCEDPLAQTIRDYRRVGKTKNTYFLNMRDEQRDGILHPNFNQNRTKTGRFSSSSAGEE